jgi:hypothetical protein
MSTRRPSYIVKVRRPWRDGLVITIGLMVIGAAGHMLYIGGHAKGREEFIAVSGKRDSMIGMNEFLRGRVGELESVLAMERQMASIDRRARELVRRTLGKRQGEMLELREELEFYRNVAINPDDGEPLTLRSFRVLGRRGDGGYAYRVIASRHMRDEGGLVKGNYAIDVVGRMPSGEAMRLPAESVLAGGATISMSFRHFGRLSGTIRLPDDFTPERVIVKFLVESLGDKKVESASERSFEWYPAGP